jgi:hypothetical protein
MRIALFLALIVSAALSPFLVSAETLSDRVSGRILLQVENHGEAWYVNPDDGLRYYMKDGPTAYQMMREFGLGISEEDFAVIETDEAMNERLLGKIVLRVNLHGEAYYVHPDDGSIHYLQNGEAAYSVMRYFSLGITNSDLALIDTAELTLPTPTVAGVTSEIATPTPTPVPTIIYIYPDTPEPTVEAEEAPEPGVIPLNTVDITSEIESIIDQIEASEAYNAVDAWYALNGEAFDQARVDWIYWSGCASKNYTEEMGWDCSDKVAELGIETFPLFKSGCFDYNSYCLPDFHFVDQSSYPDWDDLVMIPLKEAYEDYYWDLQQSYISSGYNSALSAQYTWQQNLANPDLIEEWHFDYLDAHNIETELKEILFYDR